MGLARLASRLTSRGTSVQAAGWTLCGTSLAAVFTPLDIAALGADRHVRTLGHFAASWSALMQSTVGAKGGLRRAAFPRSLKLTAVTAQLQILEAFLVYHRPPGDPC